MNLIMMLITFIRYLFFFFYSYLEAVMILGYEYDQQS